MREESTQPKRFNSRWPIYSCPECGRMFFKMRKIRLRNGKYKMVWETRRAYCSDGCKQSAYRKRKFSRLFPRI